MDKIRQLESDYERSQENRNESCRNIIEEILWHENWQSTIHLTIDGLRIALAKTANNLKINPTTPFYEAVALLKREFPSPESARN